MKKRLALGMMVVFVPLLMLIAYGMIERSFSLSMENEMTQAQLTEGIIAQNIRRDMKDQNYSTVLQAAAHYRNLYASQGMEMIFIYSGVPMGDAELPNPGYASMLGGSRCAMLDGASSPQLYAIADPITDALTLLVLRDVSGLYAQRGQMQREFFLYGAIGTVGVGLLVWLLSWLLIRPISRFTLAAQAIAGHSSPPFILSTSRKDELGLLAKAFDEMQCAVEQREAALVRDAEKRQALLDALAHEMRTPLCSLLGNTRLLQTASLPLDKQNELLGNMAVEIKRLSDMDTQLMKLVEWGREDILPKPVRVLSLLQESVERLSCQAYGVLLCVTGEDAIIGGDSDLLTLLVDNLVVNAIRASQSGQTVTLTAFQDGFSVRDCGVGMTAQQLARACEPFYKADTARTRRFGGAGLGLTLCQKIAALHGGALTLTSTPHEGTLATFTTLLQPVADSVAPMQVSYSQEVDNQ